MNKKSSKTEAHKTVLVITVGMLVLYVLTKKQFALNASIFIGLLGLASNYLALKIDYVWMKIAWVLSKIMPNIILTIFFYVVLTPIALLSRIIDRKDQLSLKNTTSTLFKDSNKEFSKDSFEKPW